MSIFKACDVRGVYPTQIDEATAHRIGRAIAMVLGRESVVVGGDVRLSTPGLKQAVIDGLTASGCDVVDIGIVPTPVFYFAKRKLGATGGVMVTASHNPPEYNGLKIALGDLPITEAELQRIAGLSEANDIVGASVQVRAVDVVGDYEDDMAARGAELLTGLPVTPKIVLDCGNGCYSEIAPRLMRRLGVECEPLFCEIDGSFPNRSPNSAIPSNLVALCRAVVEHRADLGVAFDGDGDRVAFVDEHGTAITADQEIAIIAEHHKGGVAPGEEVVMDIKCSAGVHDVVRQRGGIPVMEKSGHTYIKTRMIRDNAALGGEMSGHLFYRELGGGDDGLYSALAMMGIVGMHGPLSKLAASVPEYATTPDLRVRVAPSPELLEKIAAAFPVERVMRLDGVRVAFDDGWGLARLSVTEPVVTLRFEGRDEAALGRIMDEFLAPVPELRAAIGG